MYRTRPELAAEMLQKLCRHKPQAAFHLLVDSSYGGESVLANLPDNCDLTSRLLLIRDDYSEQDSYDDYDQGSSSKSRKAKSKKKSASTGPNWTLIGGVIAGVLMLVGGVVAFWPSGPSDAAATSGAPAPAATTNGQQPSGPFRVGNHPQQYVTVAEWEFPLEQLDATMEDFG